MPTLSGTLRFWNEGEASISVSLEGVEFTFHETWEPSLIVEERYVAEVAGRQVMYAEIRGYATGLAIKVAGADHAELVDWMIRTLRSVGGVETEKPMPSFVDSIFWDVVRRSS